MYKFTSKSHIAINVPLKDGGNAHISFTEVTGKGSVYYTDNEQLADAMRNHHKFGKLFKEVEVVEKKAEEKKLVADATGTVAGSGGKTLTFDNNEDAKDYMAEKYGISRSKMRTRAAIVEAAKGVGVTISWGEAGGAPAADATGTVADDEDN